MNYKYHNNSEFENSVRMLSSIGYGKRPISEWLNCSISTAERTLKRLNIKAHRSINTEEQFWSLIDVKGHNECWIWQRGVNNKGYGQFSYKGRAYFSHRLSYILSIGKIPKGRYLCHKCDTPRCCNPNHLFLGDGSDNMIDRSLKGRNPNQKLNSEKVKQIRQLNKKYGPKYISELLDINVSTIKAVIYNETWRHV